VPNECIVDGDLGEELFGTHIREQDLTNIHHSVILCSTNDKVQEINNQIIQRLPGNIVVTKSIDEIVCENGENPVDYPTEFLNSLLPSGLPPHELYLKPGIMLLRNLDIKNGICNGVRLKVVRITSSLLDCAICTGTFSGKRVLIPKIKLEPSGDMLPFHFRRKQFPVRLSFAMTINKSQGQTFEKVGVHLEKPVFTHGQLYVAFSRVRSISTLKVKLKHREKETTNIVFPEILRQ
jgi:hypothetical protein